MRPWIQYTLIRILLFAGLLAALMAVSVHWLWAALIAAGVGECIAYIFFRRQRDAVATSIADRRARGEKNADLDEDAAIDSLVEPDTRL